MTRYRDHAVFIRALAMTEAPGGGWRDGSWASDNREMLLNYLHVPQGFGAGQEGVKGGKWRPEISTCLTGGVLL